MYKINSSFLTIRLDNLRLSVNISQIRYCRDNLFSRISCFLPLLGDKDAVHVYGKLL